MSYRIRLSLAHRDGETPIDSRIYYIKMSKAQSVFLSDPDHDEAYINGNTLTMERNRMVDAKIDEKRKDEIDCDRAIGFDVKRDMYVYIVNRYSRVMDSKKLRKLVNRVLPSGLVSDFPQTTTVDQNFYREQVEAFVGLGYLQALKLDTK